MNGWRLNGPEDHEDDTELKFDSFATDPKGSEGVFRLRILFLSVKMIR